MQPQDFTEDAIPDFCLFRDQSFDMDDFVTVDEVGDDTSTDQPPKLSPEAKGQSSSAFSVSKRTSTCSLLDQKTLSTYRSTRSSLKSGSASQLAKKSKDSSSASSSSAAAGSSACPGRTKQQSSCTTSSSLVQQKDKMVETEISKAEHHAGDTAAETGPSSDIPCPQEGEEELTSPAHKDPPAAGADPQSQEENKDSITQQEEEKDEGDNYQILDSFDENTEGKTQSVAAEEGLTSLQVPDGKSGERLSLTSISESDMDVDGSFRVPDSVSEEHKSNQNADGKPTLTSECSAAETQAEDTLERSTDELVVLERHNTAAMDEEVGHRHSSDVQTPAEENKDIPGRQTFEIIDSVDNQTAAEDECPHLTQTSSDQISVGDTTENAGEEDAYEIIDAVEELPTSTESKKEDKEKRTRASKRRPTRASRRDENKLETAKEEDASMGHPRKGKEITVISEETYEVVDSVEEEPAEEAGGSQRSGRRRRTSKLNVVEESNTPDKDQEATFVVLDSVEDETAKEETVVATRTIRGRRRQSATKKNLSNEAATQEDTPTRSRHPPARKSQDRTRGQIIPVKKSVSSGEVAALDGPLPTVKRGRGRPRKEVKKKDEVTYEILDSVDEEMATGDVQKEEEPLYEIVDSLEDEQGSEETVAATDGGVAKQKSPDDLSPSSAAGQADAEKVGKCVVVKLDEVSKEEEVSDEPCGEEEVRKKQLTKEREQEERKSLLKQEEDEWRSTGAGRRTRSGRGKAEMEEREGAELVTLDELRVDEAGQETVGSREWEGGVEEEELQALVTLDEIVDDEEESDRLKPSPPGRDDQSMNPQVTSSVMSQTHFSSEMK